MSAERASKFRRFFRSPKGFLLLLLLGLTAVAAPFEGPGRVAGSTLGAVTASVLLDAALTLLRRGVLIFPDGALVSGLIVALVLSPAEAWYVPIAGGAIAVASKHLLRTPQYHLFNPAALALLVSALGFSSGQPWWGALADAPAPFILLLLAAGYLVMERVNKRAQVLAFTGTYFGLFTLAAFLHLGEPTRIAEAFRVPFLNAALFFAFFMLTDPPTSPNRAEDQVWFGMLVGVTSVAAYLILPGPSFLFLGLLVGNAWLAVRRGTAEPAPNEALPWRPRLG